MKTSHLETIIKKNNINIDNINFINLDIQGFELQAIKLQKNIYKILIIFTQK